MRKQLLWLVLVPGLALGQTFGNEIDALLDAYFSGEITQTPADEPVAQDPIMPLLLSEIEAENLATQYEKAVADLAALEEKTQMTEAALWQLNAQKNTAQTQLRSIDANISVRSAYTDELAQHVSQWQDKLNIATTDIYMTQAAYRAEKKTYEQTIRKAYLRAERIGNDRRWGTAQWLFSRQGAASVQDQRRKERWLLQQHERNLGALSGVNKVLKGEEQTAAKYARNLAQAQQRLTAERAQLRMLADAKAQIIQFAQGEEQTLIAQKNTFQDQQKSIQSTIQNLGQKGSEVTDPEIPQPVISLQFPFSETVRVTAGYHEESYAAVFGRPHTGTDFALKQGSNVLSAAAGTVAEASDNGYGYSYVIIQHAGGISTVYGHMSQIFVNAGDSVLSGQVIGHSGGTPGTRGAGPYTTGPHLHFEVYQGGVLVDPEIYLPKAP